jgi:hypothetical protein
VNDCDPAITGESSEEQRIVREQSIRQVEPNGAGPSQPKKKRSRVFTRQAGWYRDAWPEAAGGVLVQS